MYEWMYIDLLVYFVAYESIIYFILTQSKMTSTLPPFGPHLSILHSLLNKGYPNHLLSRQQCPLTLKIPSLISCGLYDDAISQILSQQLSQNEEYCQLHIVWLIICCYMVQTDYEEYDRMLEKEGKYRELVNQWKRMYKPVGHPEEIKAGIRKKFQELLLKAQEQSYYNMQRMPVFLIPCSWLQKFYSPTLPSIPPIDTTILQLPSPYIQTQQKYLHYNYNLKPTLHQNIDYKIVSYEAWIYLYNNFGGCQFRRFTTNQKQAICQIVYKKIKVVVTEERYLFGRRVVEIFVGRFDTVVSIVERVKRILVEYQVVEFQNLGMQWQPILVSHIQVQQLFDIIQDQDRNLIKQSSPQTHQLTRLSPTTDIQDMQPSPNDVLLFLLHPKSTPSSILDIHLLPIKAQTKKHTKCHTCSTTQSITLEQCQCKQVYFCSKQCRNKNKEHLKICDSLMKEETVVGRLVDLYGVAKRKYQWEKVKGYGKVGLENLGNTCYMNAALQCVLSVEGLNQLFLQNGHVSQLNVTNVLGTGGDLACAYGQFIKDYYTTNRRSLQPIRILKIISHKNAQFRGHNHQDSQQFFNYFFDKLHQDLNKVREKPYVENIQSDGRPDSIVSQLSWKNYLKRNQSFISQNFAGQYRSQIRCPDCTRVSITFDPFLSVTLPFPRQQIQEELSGYFLSAQGQFQKVQRKVKASMGSEQFIAKFFNEPVYPLWLRNKVPQTEWKMKKSVSSNISSRGVLIFYEKPQKSSVQLQVKYEGFQIFHRKVFTNQITSQQQLKKKLYKSIKFPLLKATKNDQLMKLSLEQYLSKCIQTPFIQITENSIQSYPFTKGTVTIKLKLNLQNCPFAQAQKIKFDYSSRPYTPNAKFPISRSISDQITLSQLLTSFSQPQQLTQQNSWYCNKCKDHKLAQKIMSIYKSGKYLVIHLKRFNHKGNRYVIYGEKVRMPVKLNNYQSINGVKYELFGVVNHYGSLSMGHYTAFVQREKQWFYADDSSFKKRQLDGSDAYLLFYRRLDQ